MADFKSSLTGQQMDAALTDMAMYNSEAWAVGKRNGINVTSDDETYNNNSRYWASRASAFNTSAQDAAARAEAAIPVGSESAVLFDRAQSLTDEQKKQAKDNIGATGSANYNLIDNAWFNVREYGAGPFSGSGSFANRWEALGTGPSVTLLGLRGIRLSVATGSASVQQIIRYRGTELNNKTLTLSILTSAGVQSASGTFTTGNDGYRLAINFSNGEWSCRLGWYASVSSLYPFIRILPLTTNTSVDIYAVKLEIGNQSTLDADVRPEPRTEAERCHYLDMVLGAPNGAMYVGLCYCVSGASGAFKLNLPVGMALSPTVTLTGTAMIYAASGSYTVSAVALDRIGANAMQLALTVSGTPTTGDIGDLSFANGTKIALKVSLA